MSARSRLTVIWRCVVSADDARDRDARRSPRPHAALASAGRIDGVIEYVRRWNRDYLGEEAAGAYSSIIVTFKDRNQTRRETSGPSDRRRAWCLRGPVSA